MKTPINMDVCAMNDDEAIEWARKHLDLSKNLNDQGYYGPFPNDADPRTTRSVHDTGPGAVEYYDWVDGWIKEHDGKFDNKKMFEDRCKHMLKSSSRDYIIMIQ